MPRTSGSGEEGLARNEGDKGDRASHRASSSVIEIDHPAAEPTPVKESQPLASETLESVAREALQVCDDIRHPTAKVHPEDGEKGTSGGVAILPPGNERRLRPGRVRNWAKLLAQENQDVG